MPLPRVLTWLSDSRSQCKGIQESACDLPQEVPGDLGGRTKARSDSLETFTMSLHRGRWSVLSTHLNQSVRVTHGRGDGGLERWVLHLGASGKSGSGC